MRATQAGKRRPTKDRLTAAPPDHAPGYTPKNEYENHSAFPGKHLAIFPNKPFAEGIVCPIVRTAKIEGYEIETEIPPDIIVPEGHELMSIDAETFAEMQEDMIADVEERQNPGGKPRSEDEAKERIQANMGGSKSFGTTEGRVAQQRISLSQMEGNFAQVVAATQAVGDEAE